MRVKLIGLFAALLLVAACQTAPEEAATTAGEGAAVAAGEDAAVAALEVEGATPGSVEDFALNVGDRVFFDLDKSVLSAQGRRTLERQAEWLKLYPNKILTVEGHCDERGTREYNLALGERRSAAVKDYLTALGIDENRIETISYGKERPYALGHNEAAWDQNRRGVTVVN